MWPGTELWHWVRGPNGVQMNSRAVKPNTQWGYHWERPNHWPFLASLRSCWEEFHASSFHVLSVGIPLCIRKSTYLSKVSTEKSVKEMISPPMERGIRQKYFSTCYMWCVQKISPWKCAHGLSHLQQISATCPFCGDLLKVCKQDNDMTWFVNSLFNNWGLWVLSAWLRCPWGREMKPPLLLRPEHQTSAIYLLATQ